jgi:hypothetical protein
VSSELYIIDPAFRGINDITHLFKQLLVALSKDIGTDSRSPVIDRGVKGGMSELAGRGKVNKSHSIDSLTNYMENAL